MPVAGMKVHSADKTVQTASDPLGQPDRQLFVHAERIERGIRHAG